MASRKDLARQYMELVRDSKIDEALGMLADDIVTSNPMTGTQTGKEAVGNAMRNRPAGGGGANIQWSEPEEEGYTVKIVGTGSPFGPIRIVVGFNDQDQISRIDIGMA